MSTVDELLADVLDAAELQESNPATRYFRKLDGHNLTLMAKTLAYDVVEMGPLGAGDDKLMWSYKDGVWSPDKDVVRARAADLMDELYRDTHARHAESIISLDPKTPTITAEPIGDYINFTNGLLDWRTGTLVDHTPDVLTTVQLPVDYDPDATCPEFDRFLSEVVPDDVVSIMWELIGYLMFSGNPLHKAVMLVGGGGNGKSTFLHVVEALLGGRRNVTAVSLHDLANTRFATASLFGKLANIAGDIDAKYLESTAVFKQVTGGDTLRAEHKGRDSFDFAPWAVPVFSANKVPPSADTTVGYFRRWLVLQFPNSFIGKEDRWLEARLTQPSELRGIAAKAIRALPELLDRGDFELSESARAARDDFIRRVDQVRTWLDECCEVAPEHPWCSRTSLYGDYKMWARRDNQRPVSAKEFYDRLGHVDYVLPARGGPSSIRGFTGIKVVDHALEGAF